MTRTTKVQLLAVIAALALVSTMVLRTSSAAFSGTTENAGNAWDAGTVTLTDDDGGSALFTASGMVPGDSSTQCIEVTYTGTVDTSGTAFYVSTYTDSDGASDTGAKAQLSDDLDVDVLMGALGSTCSPWSGVGATTLHSATALQSLPATYGAGGTAWTPTAAVDTTRAFQITVTLGADTANDAQGDGATATFMWEAQS